MKNWELIGHCGVDSGQLMICDPCYVDSHWENKDFAVERKLKDKEGNFVEYKKDFANYDSKLEQYGNKSINDLQADGTLVAVETEQTDEFNYDGVCRKTLTDEACGEIQNGLATVFSSGYGDGIYDVYAKRNEEGRIMQVMIDME